MVTRELLGDKGVASDTIGVSDPFDMELDAADPVDTRGTSLEPATGKAAEVNLIWDVVSVELGVRLRACIEDASEGVETEETSPVVLG
ncbi:hypothetical protein PspLS_07739 [Pyricularia sp. CBS 133598]|nr:hypothetical protein PspLS_07739 [Pyricularia sp. CBS 133598]